MIRHIYDWTLNWARTPYGTWALFIIALAESSFFPIPPDVLLIALGISIPKKSFKYAFVCSAGSIAGGCLGYLIGWQFMNLLGENIINFYGLNEKINYISQLYKQYDAWALAIAGFTPIPFKVFTITAGMFNIDFTVFIIASAASRTLRFVLIGSIIYVFGSGIKSFIDKYFNMAVVIFVILLIGGFISIKYLF